MQTKTQTRSPEPPRDPFCATVRAESDSGTETEHRGFAALQSNYSLSTFGPRARKSCRPLKKNPSELSSERL
eukprot:9005641-Alexandrium_andersonii.AAC.1